jgi:hypothetical protein
VDRLVLRKASTHPIRYFISLPRGFTRQTGKKWPILFVLAGRDVSPFEDMAEGYAKSRGELPFILVVPCTFNNARYEITGPTREIYQSYYGTMEPPPGEQRMTWDEDGVLAILKDLQTELDAERRIYVSGFSAGAKLTYHMTLTRPAMLAGVATVCGNFFDQVGYRDQHKPHNAADLNLPVRIFVGGNDPLLHQDWPNRRGQVKQMIIGAAISLGVGLLTWAITRRWRRALVIFLVGICASGAYVMLSVRDIGNEVQSRDAEVLLRDLGYTDVTRELVPGLTHEPSPGLVIQAFRPYWERKNSEDCTTSRAAEPRRSANRAILSRTLSNRCHFSL